MSNPNNSIDDEKILYEKMKEEMQKEIDSQILFDVFAHTLNWHTVDTTAKDMDIWCEENIGKGKVILRQDWSSTDGHLWVMLTVFGITKIAVKNIDDYKKLKIEVDKREMWGILSK